MRTTGSLATAIVLAVLVACDDPFSVDNTDFEARESFDFRVAVASQTRVRLEGINSEITVIGAADPDSFIVRGVRRVGSESVADAEAYLDRLQVEVIDQGSQLFVRTVQPQNTEGRNLVVDYELVVPRDQELVIENINGVIDVDSMRGDLSVADVNGVITLTDIAASMIVELVNGNITADVTPPPDGLIDMAIVNGDIGLAIPSTTSATFSATVVNGTISTSGLNLQNEQRSRTSVTGILGAGDGQIDLATVNGNIAVSGF